MPTDLFKDIPDPPVTDHGALTGLSDDDHGQYVHAAPATSARNLVTAAGGYQSILSLKRGAGGSVANADLFSVINNDTSHLFRVRIDEFGDNRVQSAINMWLDNRAQLRFYETSTNGTNYVALRAPASLSANRTFTLPDSYGTSGHFLTTDGSGGLGWSTFAAGSDSQILYNSGGVVTGDYGLIYLESTSSLAVAGTLSCNNIIAEAGSETVPAYSFGSDSNTGMYSSAADTLNLATGGTSRVQLGTSSFVTTVPVRTSNGTAGVPSHSFSGDSNTGMYRIGADNLGFSVGGSLALELVNSSGLATSIHTTARLTNGTNYVGFDLPSLSGDTTYTLPATDGTSGDLLSTDGSGNLSWVAPSSGGSGSPGGSDTQVQFNSSGSFAGDSGLTYNASTDTLSVGGSVLVGDGSNSAPSVSFTSDPDSGLYASSGNVINIAAGGVRAITFASDTTNPATTVYKELRISNGTNYISINLPTLSGNVVLTLPPNDGSANQILQTDGNGVLTWVDPPATGAPNNLEYIVRTASGSLSNEWVLTAGDGIDVTYASGNATISVESNVVRTTGTQTISGAKTFNAGACLLNGSASGKTDLRTNATGSTKTVTIPDVAGEVLTTGYSSTGLITGNKYFDSGVQVGIGTAFPGGTVEIQTGASDAKACVRLDQDDQDQPFISFEGTSASDQSANLTSDTSGWTLEGYIRIEINGTTKWIPYGSF